MRTALSDEHGTLVRYFLGELPAEERERVEERYMLDASYEELRDAAEMDLIDAYVCGRLTPQQRLHFERFYLITAERRQAVQAAYLSRVYRERVAVPPARPERFSTRFRLLPRQVLFSAAAAVLVALAGGAIVLYSHHGATHSKEQAQAPSPVQPSTAPGHAVPPGPSSREAETVPLLAKRPSTPPRRKTRPAPETDSNTTAALPRPPQTPSSTNPGSGPVIGPLDWSALRPEVHEVFNHDVDLGMDFETLLRQRLEEPRTGGSSFINNSGRQVFPGNLSWKLMRFGALEIVRPDGTKAYKALVIIHCLLTDAGIGFELFNGDVMSDSTRSTDSPAGLYEPVAGAAGRSVDITGADFGATLIGEAILNACNKIAAIMTGLRLRPGRAAQVQIGATISDIVGAFGNPGTILNLRTHVVYVYDDMMITFTGGKVSDIQ